MALGASRSEILTLLLRRGLLLAGIGIGVGTLASIIMVRFMKDLLFGVVPLDPSIFSTVTLVLILASIASALGPALRAAALDPIRTLREQ
jgi:putative ABC transport system permease protein